MIVLEIGGNRTPKAPTYFPDAVHETMDLNPDVNPTYLNDARFMPDSLANKYDVVMASHILEHIPYWETGNTLDQWYKILKPGGMLHIFVPSLEWVAKEVLSEKMSRAVMPHLHGGLVSKWDIHLASFTMRALRAYLEEARFAVVLARTMPLPIMIAGTEMRSEEHYVIGMKKEDEKPRKRHKKSDDTVLGE